VTDKTAEKPESTGWLVLIYRVPPEPTRLRSTVWRRIKSLGAIYLQSSAAALPASTSSERALRKLRAEIIDMNGTAALLSCRVLAGEPPAQQDPPPPAHKPTEEPLVQKTPDPAPVPVKSTNAPKKRPPPAHMASVRPDLDRAVRQNLWGMWPYFAVFGAVTASCAASGFVLAPLMVRLPGMVLRGLAWAYPVLACIPADIAAR